MEDHAIDPGWRDQASRIDSRSRAVSPRALGFSIAAHLLVAGVAVVVLLHLGASRPSRPEYLVARIVDRIPGTGGGSAQANPASSAAGPAVISSATVSNATPSRPVTHRLRKIRSWMRTRIVAAKTEVRDYERKKRDERPSIPSLESRPVAVAVAAPPPLKSATASASGASTGARTYAASGEPGDGNGAGDGTGGSRDARVAYGSAPAPDYPVDARRMEEQGIVMLRVLVGADGAAQQVEIVHSSGFRLLDDAALETVRERWRFVPAMRAGAAVESWVTVPIRFALTEADAGD